ncbi:hypothetical protein L9F63_016783, partial [Diploptera punctata]
FVAISGLIYGQCIDECTREWHPLCGIDGDNNNRTFGNLCVYELYNCQNPSN